MPLIVSAVIRYRSGLLSDVRFTPGSDRIADIPDRQLCAKLGSGEPTIVGASLFNGDTRKLYIRSALPRAGKIYEAAYTTLPPGNRMDAVSASFLPS